MKNKSECCPSGKMPILPITVLVLAILWVLSDLNVFVLNIPWLPLIIGIAAIGCIAHHCCKK